MITLYGFGRVNDKVIGETRDLRIQWVLEEVGLPYRVAPIDHTAGENKTRGYHRLNPFEQLPVLDDDGYVLTETGAIALYLAEKSGKLTPPDFKGRMQVTRWCFVALNTVEFATMQIALIDLAGASDPTGSQRRPAALALAHRQLVALEDWLTPRVYLANDEFSMADLLMTNVLRQIRNTGMLDRYPRISAFRDRNQGRPTWSRAVALYEKRLGVEPGFVR